MAARAHKWHEPDDGETRTVNVCVPVPMRYQRGDPRGPFVAGWDLAVPMLGIAIQIEERARCMVEDAWARENEPEKEAG